jgi:hypothetical protein
MLPVSHWFGMMAEVWEWSFYILGPHWTARVSGYDFNRADDNGS